MTGSRSTANKAKIARRVVEVLEFFDDDHPEATVMDIVRRYDRPQSSTSELLSSLVELGLLYKDPYARSYRPTVRAAMLGATTQQGPVRDGRLVQFLDRLVAQTGLPVLLLSRIGLETQIVNARQGSNVRLHRNESFRGGMRDPVTRSAAGLLLLSDLPENKREAALRRLNSESEERFKFVTADMLRRIADYADQGHAFGPAGFGTDEKMVAAILPAGSEEQPLVAAIVMDKSSQQEGLTQCLLDAVGKSFADPRPRDVETLATAA